MLESEIIEKKKKEKGKDTGGYSRWVKIWLIIGLVMIFLQVVIGGITRLTGSGLSITKWEIVTGTIPPLNAEEWDEAFDLYKATPQYQKINEGMSLGDFKFIYFWEYIHRLWARVMGLVFIVPFLLFWFYGKLDTRLLRRLITVFVLAGVVASFGWIMVKSGLSDRPWVDAYKLSMHLSLALILYSYLLWTALLVIQPRVPAFATRRIRRFAQVILIVLGIQIVLGGIMSGMKAGLNFPSWPLMNGQFVPTVLANPDMWSVDNFVNYDVNNFMPALIQFLHRNTAYLLSLLIVLFFVAGLRLRGTTRFSRGLFVLLLVLVAEVALGVLTLVNSIGMVPPALGVLHQAGALLLLSLMLFQYYQLRIAN